jgi:hypothetical protein
MINDWQDNLLLTAAVIGLITSFVIVVRLVWGMRILTALAKAAEDSDDQKWLSPDEAMKLIMDAATGGNLKFFVDVPAQTISQGITVQFQRASITFSLL